MRLSVARAGMAFLAVAASACGGSAGSSKRFDAGGLSDGAIGGDSTKADAPHRDGQGSFPVDGGQAYDASPRPDVPWSVPDLSGTCHVDITPLSPASFVNLTAGPTAFLRVQGSITWGQTTPYPPNWTWSVVRSDGQTILPSATGVDPSIVQFPIAIAARYDITVRIGDQCAGADRALVQDTQNDYRLYRLRVLPPSTAANGAIPYEVDLKIVAGSSQNTKDVDFDTGTPVSIDPSTGPETPLAVAVPSTIRIQSSGSTWITYGRSTNQVPFRTVLDTLLEYQVLVVPDPPTSTNSPLPAFLLNRATSDNVRVDAQFLRTNANPLPIPLGLTVAGHLTTPDGPAAGATLTMRSYQPSATAGQTDLIYSTVGLATDDGSYSLRVNPGGMLSIVVAPPEGSPLPMARIDQGINLAGTATVSPALDFQWLPLPTTDLSVTVAFPGGLVPVEPVRVHLESTTGGFPKVGILSVAASPEDNGEDAWSTICDGIVRRDGETDASGQVTFASLPKGMYKVALVPPGSLSGSAITSLMIDTSTAGDTVEMTIPIARKIAVSGRLLDGRNNSTTTVAGATVVATDLGHDVVPNVVSTTVAEDGTYLLVLDPDRTYRLVAQPMAGRGLPSYVPLYGFSTGNAEMALDDQRLPEGVQVHGHVTYAGSAVPGSIVQAFCLGLPPDCVDRNNLAAGAPPAFASAVSNANGDYAIYLPGPASNQ